MLYSHARISNTNRIILKSSGINDKVLNTAYKLNLPLIYEGHSAKELQDLTDLNINTPPIIWKYY